MNLLSRSEEIIMVTILKLKDGAYGVSIRDQIFRDTGDRWSFASIYQPLSRLERKKYVTRSKGDTSAERGEKNRYYYSLTQVGERALLKIKNSHDRVWEGAPVLQGKSRSENE